MEPLLTQDQIHKTGFFIFKNGRLLERKLFEYFFENGSQQACLKALSAYQNDDGGFGNGLEPDLLCPDSTAIGAETALVVFDQLDYLDPEMSLRLFDWISARQNAAGFIEHPPSNLARYPHQPWWANPDKERILSLAGMMKKWMVDRPGIFERAKRFYLSVKVPEEVSFYQIDTPYPEYPWWRPIFLMDGLIQLKKMGYI